MRAGYTQANAGVGAITSKTLVNGRWSKVVNIASTKMMKKVFRRTCILRGSGVPRDGVGEGICIALAPQDDADTCDQPHAWLVTALPRAACAAASRAIGTR